MRPTQKFIRLHSLGSQSQEELPSPGNAPIHEWPDGPRPLERTPLSGLLYSNIGNVFFIIFSLFCFVFCGLVWVYDGQNIDTGVPSYDFLNEIRQLGPTIFPLVFAAAVGNNLRTFAFWRLERGERLGLLDQLLGSTTVINAISTQILLGAFNTAGVMLVLVWLMSPLGGQATYRIFSEQNRPLPGNPSISYPNMNWTEAFNPGYTSDISELYQMSSKTTFFTAAVFGSPSVKHSKVDLWGNCKVPRIEELEERGAKTSDGWIDVDSEEDTTYSSLLGVPLESLPDPSTKDVNTSLTINTTYWTLDCSNRTMQSNFTDLLNDRYWFGPQREWNDWGSIQIATHTNYTKGADGVDTSKGQDQTLLYETTKGGCDVGDEGCIFRAECIYHTTFAETRINCTANSCGATQIRRLISKEDQGVPTDPITPLNSRNGLWAFATFFARFAFASPQNISNSHYYLLDPDNPYGLGSSGKNNRDDGTSVDLMDIPKPDFELRLSQLLNTLWISLVADYLVPHGGSSSGGNGTEKKDLGDWTDQLGNKTVQIARVTAETRAANKVLACSFPWLAVVVVVALFILAVSVAGVVVDAKGCRAPRLDMNASTLLRGGSDGGGGAGNAGFFVGGTALSDLQMGRLMRRRMVRLGDVKPEEEEVGRIGVAIVDRGGGPGVGRLRVGRLYE